MVREVKTEITIKAPKEKIWSELTDFTAYPSWNPFVISIDGEPKVGNTLSVTVDIPDSGNMSFKPRVIDVQANKRFAWLGKLLVKGVFDGEHIFELEEVSPSECLLVHREKFSGLLVSMMWKKLDDNSRRGYVKMNEALKVRCEAG